MVLIFNQGSRRSISCKVVFPFFIAKKIIIDAILHSFAWVHYLIKLFFEALILCRLSYCAALFDINSENETSFVFSEWRKREIRFLCERLTFWSQEVVSLRLTRKMLSVDQMRGWEERTVSLQFKPICLCFLRDNNCSCWLLDSWKGSLLLPIRLPSLNLKLLPC
jgi:hypothetical protein